MNLKSPDRVSVKLGRTINLGDFESARVDIGYETTVEPGEEPSDAIRRALRECSVPLQRRVKRIEAKLAARADEDED